jgi:hypothetical protein
MMRYVADTNPPTLWTKLEETFAEHQKGQDMDYDVRAEVCRQVLHRKPETLRQMLNHERPLPMFDFELVRRFCGLSLSEATALYMANAPAEKIGAMVRAHDAGPPRKEVAYCNAPAAFTGFFQKGVRKI